MVKRIISLLILIPIAIGILRTDDLGPELA